LECWEPYQYLLIDTRKPRDSETKRLLLIYKNGNRDFFSVAVDVAPLYRRWPYSRSRPVVCSIGAAFWSVSESICRLSTINSSPFANILWINLPYEEAFSLLLVIKSRYRRRLTDEHLKHCLHLGPVAYRGGGVVFKPPPPRNSEGPPKSCQTQPDCENY